MSIDINNYLSDNAKNMRRSAIRDLLSVANKPEIISFGGGFPNQDTFPVEDLKQIMNDLLTEEPHKVLQYGSTEGSVLLRQQLAKKYQADGLDVTEKNIVITTASQQAIDLVSRILINPGDTILCGLPSYLGALQAFYSYQANPVGIPKDEHAEVVVKTLCALGRKPKFIYAIPDYQNPTGVTMTMEQRLEIVEVAKKYDLIILEDSPYKEIRFDGESLPTIYSMCPERVILLGTLSKTFAPGLRLGWVLASEQVIEKIIVAKQSADLCTPILNQELAGRYIASGKFDENLKKTIALYRGKRDLMLECLEKYMPEGVTWTKPDGGLFMLVTLPKNMDARDLFNLAIKENVAFIIGEVFFCDGGGQNTLRLNFSYVSDEKMVEGVKRLARATRKLMGLE
ncbi:MAG: PLP-dependent aminotransferase family protein [Bacteroidales bacterium]|nr:PLP-dependent aminotransferase family protein [Bacteroidales bacterium]MBO7320769.1 PLP-dependent aminotransferase family protein [Bacteroidales bacterium]MBO7764607.1 PLP-dependent aminotransferase family protein [Bacteroidales bacterium]